MYDIIIMIVLGH